MYAYTYRAFWRDQGATEWNEIESSSPITWTQETTGGTPSNDDYTSVGGCRIRCHPNGQPVAFVNAGQFDQNCLSYSIVASQFEGFQRLRTIRCDGTSSGDNNYLLQPGTGVTVLSIGNCTNPSSTTPPNNSTSCVTTFNTGLVITRSECIEVTLEPPECPCCAELLPKANSILARLG